MRLKKSVWIFFFGLYLLGAAGDSFSAGRAAATSAPLSWAGSREEALTRAKKEKKKILLVIGTDACANTQYMKNTVCETVSPRNIKAYIGRNYVPWYANANKSIDWWDYVMDLPNPIPAPVLVLINPDDISKRLDRKIGPQAPDKFYRWLGKYKAKK